MRSSDITFVLCLSCVLIVLHVKSQTSCPVGWFGSRCNYRCRCVNNKCDKNGQCIDTYTCLAGWFGPECQYFDIVYESINSVLTDGNDSTCADPSAPDTVTFDLWDWGSFTFTWLRVCAQDQRSAALEDLSVTFSLGSRDVNCTDLKKVAVDNTTLDMHCNATPQFNKLTLKGAAVSSLCSVHVSGGRNLALKETAKQDSTHYYVVNNVRINYTADLAVDDDVQDILRNRTCSQTSGTSTWTLVFSQTRMVHWYRVINREDSVSKLLKGLTLKSFDSKNNSQFVHQDTVSTVRYSYYYVHTPLPIKMVVITANNSENILSLCEVRVHGDSLCDSEHYGRDCELRCQCLNKVPCFVSTGMCPNGCPDGYSGQGCMTECSPEHFGKGCNQTCSKNCQAPDNANNSLCDPVTGACLNGCKDGSSGQLCENVCAAGTFGKDCKSECSTNCQASDNANNSVCHPVTGACLKGCKDGLSGQLCENVCAAGTFGKDCKSECNTNCQASDNANNSVCDPVTGACLKGCKDGSSGQLCESVASGTFSGGSIILLTIGLCICFATTFFVGYCLRKKNPTRSSEEVTTLV